MGRCCGRAPALRHRRTGGSRPATPAAGPQGRAHAAGVSGDAGGDMDVVLARCTRLREYAAEQREQVLQVLAQGGEIRTNVDVRDPVGGQREELDRSEEHTSEL